MTHAFVRTIVVCLTLGFFGCESCEGDGVSQLVPLVTPSSDTVLFGGVFLGASREQTLEVRSSGTAPIELTELVVSAGAFEIVEGAPATLQPGESVSVLVRFTPAAVGGRSERLTVRSNADNDPELEIALLAEGLAPLDCANDNECVESVFDPELGTCVITNVDGDCDDGSRCTTDDRCADGVCLGLAVSCPSNDQCSLGVCAETEGCIQIPDPDACDDENPCTLDLCDAQTGCSSENLPDGTPCGSAFSCQSAPLCFAGVCTEVPVPDGVPCSDGDICTVDDQCTAGECAGTREVSDPEVVATARTFASTSSISNALVMLSDTRAVAVDAEPLVITLLNIGDGSLEPISTLVVDDNLGRVSDIDVVNASTALVTVFGGVSQLVDLSGDAVLLRGVIEDGCPSPASVGDLLYCCRFNSSDIIDVSNIDAPVSVGSFPACNLPAARGDTLATIDQNTLRAFDLSVPNAPVARASLTLDGLERFSDVGVSAHGVVTTQFNSPQPLVLYDEATLQETRRVDLNSSSASLDSLEDEAVVAVNGEVRFYALAPEIAVSETVPVAVASLRVSPSGAYFTGRTSGGDIVVQRATGAIHTHVMHGNVDVSRSTGAVLYVLSGGAFRTIDTTGGVISFNGGGVAGVSARSVTLGIGELPLVGVAFQRTATDVQIGPRFSVSDPSSPVPLGQIQFGSDHGEAIFNGATDGIRLAAAVLEADELLLTEYRAGDLPFDSSQAQPVRETRLTTSLVSTSASSGFSALSTDGAHLAHAEFTNTGGDPVGLWVVSLPEDPDEAASLVAEVAPSTPISSLAVAQGLVLVVEGQVSSIFGGTDAALYVPVGGELVRSGSVPLSLGGKVLQFDGRTGVIATKSGLVFVDTSAGLTEIGTLATSPGPLGAELHDERLVVTSRDTVELVSPPCPPAP